MLLKELLEIAESLKYEDPKGFGRKLFNKVMGVASGPYKYKVGDTVSYVMDPPQEGGKGTGKITKLLNGHHYLVNGKPVNQFEITQKITESAMAERHQALQDAIMDEFDLTDSSPRVQQIVDYLIDGKDNDDLDEYLFMHFEDQMPYGTRKARDDDPSNWITDEMSRLFHKYL
jgi:hypothetical protein